MGLRQERFLKLKNICMGRRELWRAVHHHADRQDPGEEQAGSEALHQRQGLHGRKRGHSVSPTFGLLSTHGAALLPVVLCMHEAPIDYVGAVPLTDNLFDFAGTNLTTSEVCHLTQPPCLGIAHKKYCQQALTQ